MERNSEKERYIEMIRASVAMAVYNGEKYIAEQMDSILNMMGKDDELVISIDESKDHTRRIVDEYAEKDTRIRVIQNKYKHGVSGNFTNAVMNCKGKYILMSDQDDIWLDDKIEKMVATMENSGADLVIHDGRLADEKLVPYGATLFERNKADISPIMNFIRGRFLGCCMCFRRETMEYILPFPDVSDDFPHDIFATILVGIKGKIVLINDILIYHRMHAGNATPKKRNHFFKLAYKRVQLFLCIMKRLISYKRKGK